MAEKEADSSFQLNLTDLMELEKVKDIEERNRILKSASSSRDIVWRAHSAVAEEARNKVKAKIIEMLSAEPNSIPVAPENVSHEIYSGKWETLKRFSLDEDAPKEIKIKKKEKDEVYYLSYIREILVVKKAAKKPETKEDKAKKERDRKRKEARELQKHLDTRRTEFVQAILNGIIKPLPAKKENELLPKLWKTLTNQSFYFSLSSMTTVLTGKSKYSMNSEEDWDAATKKMNDAGMFTQMIAILSYSCDTCGELCNYDASWNKDRAHKLLDAFDILKEYGWSFTEEEALLNGTHELYEKPEPEEPAEPEKTEEKSA